MVVRRAVSAAAMTLWQESSSQAKVVLQAAPTAFARGGLGAAAASGSGTTCPQAAWLAAGGTFRHMSWQRSVEKGMRSFQDLINIPRLMHPDIYDSGEKQATDMYKFHGKVMDPYYKKNPLASWNLFANNNEGWDELERRSRYFHNRMWAYRVCYQSIWGFSPKALKEHVAEVYAAVNAAVAASHTGRRALDGVKDVVAPSLLDAMQADAARLQQSGRSVAWRMVKPPSPSSNIRLVNGFLVRGSNNPQLNSKLYFVQWTFEIESEQTFAVYERTPRGGAPRLVAGSPEAPVRVVDHWVFERAVLKSWFLPKPGPRGAEWRLVARLQQPAGRPPPLKPVPV
uniref:Tim44-like domain-containing protein n=1 Tax=Chlamydomonas euryale TaxID=1486919 RepID=A0A7R9YYU2_9CHLO